MRASTGIWGRLTGAVLLAALAAGVCVTHADWVVNPDSVVELAKSVAIGFAASGFLAALSCVRRYRDITRMLRCREFAFALLSVALLATLSAAFAVLDYLCVALAPPPVENHLVRFDAMLGFHWPDLYRWVMAQTGLHRVLDLAYRSGMPQLIAVPFILAAARRVDDLAEFVAQFMFAVIVVVLVSTPFPAASAFIHFGITDPGTASTVTHYDLLRSGQFHRLNLAESQGLVSLPSFHVMLALLFAYAVRHVRYVFPAAVVLNAVMIASTPTQGGHYLADVIAGLVCGVLSIVAVRRWMAGRRTTETAGPRAASPT
ncbi:MULTISPECIES: phosphatase PAP2 family protein [unclassified Burkholderia]|uniref:phosphatase PAP2 family protein n=1 Tax=unclassified Burkholderia TaxID=2613784 RepID=UPI001E406D51|nr:MULTISPECIES: phosphatase PAP2 family protein [unclassified Burkholderia]UEP28754.1 phosphatase PAP2 family protein [Burkholderia sp. B21-007]UEP42217.1 phosphatase PAP2 family protein [Burkholderia sp. B21-005]